MSRRPNLNPGRNDRDRGSPNNRNRNRGNAGRNAEPCPEGITKDHMEGISAPYNFVPLADWVRIPHWWKAVSHDLPFRDGLSGEILYRLTTNSPLLVGGKQTKSQEEAQGRWTVGEVRPFQLADGRYAIPGSSLKGMIRSVIEIAGFGRMGKVDDARPGLRDISGNFVKASYTNKLREGGRDKIKTGFLRQRADGNQEIVPCDMARLDHRQLATWLGVSEERWDDRRNEAVPDPIFNTNNHREVRKKYAHWEQLCRDHAIADPFDVAVQVSGWEVTGLGGPVKAFPVLTGQISDCRTNKPGRDAKSKYRDFVFYNPDESQVILVSDDDWRDFLHIHGDQDGKPDMSWPGYWRRHFRNGRRVPVFYLQDGDALRIGLAYMPKLAGDYSIHDLIDSASPEHRQPPGEQHGYDLADLLFGAVNSKNQRDALRGRVSFETAVATDETLRAKRQDQTILNGPKPTYFPNYLKQKATPGTWTLNGHQYATYVDVGAARQSTVRGFKRYPARPEAMTHVQPLTAEQRKPESNKVKIQLHTLPEGTTFDGRVVFHNLKREELGALLWALTWGGKAELRHGLGMGKPFGFGQVSFSIDAASPAIPNDPSCGSGTLDAETMCCLIDAFKADMEDSAKDHGGWEASPQIANLLAMADPAAANDWSRDGRELRHMHLNAKCKQADGKTGVNEFQWAKQHTPKPFVLADYAEATGWGRQWRDEVSGRHQEAERLAVDRRAKQEAEARAQETEGMSEDEVALVELVRDNPWHDNGQFVQAIDAYLQDRDALSASAYERLTRLIDDRLPKLLADPHAKTGKKKKPAFSPRQIALSERVNALRPQ